MNRRRARRRLIGAIAIALAAAIFLPMIFESEPKAPPSQLSVEMPDKDTPFAGSQAERDGQAPPTAAASSSGSQTSSGALTGGTPPVAMATGGKGEAAVPGPGASGTVPPDQPAQPAPGDALIPLAHGSAAGAPPPGTPPATPKARPPAPAGPAAPAEKEANTSAPAKVPEKDDPRAIAALEGKVIDPQPKGGGAAASGYAVQIGAFGSAEKVKELRDKLAAAGLKNYTETLSTAQGERTRVRLGPYPSHDAAEKARERLKGVGLDGAVVPL